MIYFWQNPDWPQFTWTTEGLEHNLQAFAEHTGRITGLFDTLNAVESATTLVDILVQEAMKNAEIEGEYLSREDVASSIRNNLGLNRNKELIKDRRAAGMVQAMVAMRESFSQPLTQEMLHHWHRQLMSGYPNMQVGAWRTLSAPMQVVSGPIGKEEIHFEAPPSARVSAEMQQFIQWFNRTHPTSGQTPIPYPPIRAAIVHLYFETIHPYEDGNGRIGRILAEKALSQGIHRPVLFSISQSIEADRDAYYRALKQAQRQADLSDFIRYFLQVILDAQHRAEAVIHFTIKKVQFFDQYSFQINERQRKVLTRMLAEGPRGFLGGMNARKYAALTRVSKATATRDLQHLVRIGALLPIGAGRSRRYRTPLQPDWVS